MPHKTSGNNKEPTPPVILRRSPRFQQIVLAEPVDPKTPTPEHHRRRSRRSKPEKCSKKLDESSNARQTSVCSKRLNRCVDGCSTDRRNDLVNTSNGCLSKERILEEGANITERFKKEPPKNKVKHNNKSCDTNFDQTGTLAIIETPVLNEELSKKDRDRSKNGVAVTSAVEGPINVKDGVNKRERKVGVKRNRNQFENNIGMGQSWTKDQELALERAYFEAKPTPHFWKKVSRLVPGKSAQECFDKIHGSHLTPPQPRTRAKPRVSNTQNQSLSASKLLKTSTPNKQPRYRKQKSHIIQRTVRHMLQNQCKPNQDFEPDMFSLLEPTFISSLNLNMVLTTPDRSQETEDVDKRSSKAHKSVSRFSGLHGTTTLVSPPVLKQVKNKALHEKYIDLLNCREANRKAASVKGGKVNNKSKVAKLGSAERKEAVKAAKNALVFGAKDAIDEFQNQQATALCDLFDCESGGDDEEDDDRVF